MVLITEGITELSSINCIIRSLLPLSRILEVARLVRLARLARLVRFVRLG